MSNYNNDGYELGWDAEIEKESADFIVAEPGDYDFVVTGFERARFAGSAKMPPCNQAKLSIKLIIPGEGGECIVKHNLFLYSKTEWKLCQFFTSIGQRQKGQRVRMNWNAVIGSRGRCKVSKRSWEKDNKTYWTNDIDEFYAPEQNNGLPYRTDNLPQGQQYQQSQYQQQSFQQPQQGYQQPAQNGGYVAGKF